jgi:hypothetical protein
MRNFIFSAFCLATLAVAAMSCGSNHSNNNNDEYRNAGLNEQQYPELAQYGQYQAYGGQQVWVPNEQPPQSWVPGQNYDQQGAAYTPPYYSYLNQPQYWQYNQGIGWCYRVK